ncbi:DUF3302 domain-containing protein [Roseibium sp. SCPC15]|uniref:DUF3302 domain-containing protein n=1 Tax=Roseibium sp. SCP15 TaxID=3141376 RepID=UPI00333BAB5B
MGLIDFKLDVYDYLTFLILLFVVIAFFYAMITLGGLPGKLAEKRNHPHAESVKLGGWIGLFTIFPWIHALIWAYHDSLTIDVRKLPKDMHAKPDGDSVANAEGKLEAGIVSETSQKKMPANLERANTDESAP